MWLGNWKVDAWAFFCFAVFEEKIGFQDKTKNLSV
jgi:hypothetical protein